MQLSFSPCGSSRAIGIRTCCQNHFLSRSPKFYNCNNQMYNNLYEIQPYTSATVVLHSLITQDRYWSPLVYTKVNILLNCCLGWSSGYGHCLQHAHIGLRVSVAQNSIPPIDLVYLHISNSPGILYPLTILTIRTKHFTSYFGECSTTSENFWHTNYLYYDQLAYYILNLRHK
jgi:hypothetical protein